MAPVHGDEYNGTHFTQIVANALGHELIAFARSGMSNGAICLQIEAAITAKPDLIIVGTTSPDRIEIAVNSPQSNDNRMPLQSIYYYSYDGDNNFKLPQEGIPWYRWHKNSKPTLVSEPIVTFLECYNEGTKPAYQNIPDIDTKTEVVKQWFDNLYHPAWKRKIDSWCLSATIAKLQTSGIPYIIAYEWLEIDLPIPVENTISARFKPYLSQTLAYDPGYHTTVEAQQQIANLVMAHITEHNLLKTNER